MPGVTQLLGEVLSTWTFMLRTTYLQQAVTCLLKSSWLMFNNAPCGVRCCQLSIFLGPGLPGSRPRLQHNTGQIPSIEVKGLLFPGKESSRLGWWLQRMFHFLENN